MHIIPFCNGLVAVARTGSVYVTISITVERYFAIVHPLKDFMAIKKVLMPFTIAFSILFNLMKVICNLRGITLDVSCKSFSDYIISLEIIKLYIFS